MTRTSPEALIKAIQETGKKARRSKAAARKFLIELGVIEEDKTETKTKSIKRKSK